MSSSQFSGSMTNEPHEEYVWPSYGGLGLQDIQAISNLAGITYSYGNRRVMSSECAEPVESVDHGRWHGYDVQHPQTKSIHYTYEAPPEEQHLQALSHSRDDDYYYANGLLSTHRFSESTHTIQTQPPYQQMTSSFLPDVQKSPVNSRFDPQERFSTSLTPLPFTPAPTDNPVDNSGSYTKINHDFIPLNQHSTYSELSANLIYMTAPTTGLEGEVHVIPRKEGRAKRQKKDKVVGRVKAVDRQLKRDLEGTPLSPASSLKRSKTESKSGRRRGPGSIDGGQPSLPIIERFKGGDNGQAGKAQPTKHIPPPSSVGRASKLSADQSSTKKKLGLACLFCRERKIACGRPSESNPDQTCNQCARRFFKCEYPIESRRGQHKRPKNKPGVA